MTLAGLNRMLALLMSSLLLIAPSAPASGRTDTSLVEWGSRATGRPLLALQPSVSLAVSHSTDPQAQVITASKDDPSATRLTRPTQPNIYTGDSQPDAPTSLLAVVSQAPRLRQAPISSAAQLNAAVRALAGKFQLKGKAAFEPDWPAPDSATALLGRELFFSKALSGDQDVACVSCHHPLLAGGDGLSLAVGVAALEPARLGLGRRYDLASGGKRDPHAIPGPNVPRNSLTIINAGLYQKNFFFDGRLQRMGAIGMRTPESLRDNGRDLMAVQARFPVAAEDEMRGYRLLRYQAPDQVRDVLVERLQVNWQGAFAKAFGDATPSAKSVSYQRVEHALSDYQRSFVLLDNPWFAFLAGDTDVINASAKRGALLFYADSHGGGLDCVSCHRGDLFSDEQFHVLAIPQIGRGVKRPAAGYGNATERNGSDFGRWEVTRRKSDRHAFRTTNLLNVEMTAPYGHNGAYISLEAVIQHHLDPAAAIEVFDFGLSSLPQFHDSEAHYPAALSLTKTALASFTATKHQPTQARITDMQMHDLVSFLHALTDPCIQSKACLSEWLPDPHTRAPDGQRLRPLLPPLTAATD